MPGQIKFRLPKQLFTNIKTIILTHNHSFEILVLSKVFLSKPPVTAILLNHLREWLIHGQFAANVQHCTHNEVLMGPVSNPCSVYNLWDS